MDQRESEQGKEGSLERRQLFIYLIIYYQI